MLNVDVYEFAKQYLPPHFSMKALLNFVVICWSISLRSKGSVGSCAQRLCLLIISRGAYSKKASSKRRRSRLMRCFRSCCNWDGVSLFIVNMIVKMLCHITTVVLVPFVLVFRIRNFHLCQNCTQIEEMIKIMKWPFTIETYYLIVCINLNVVLAEVKWSKWCHWYKILHP